MNALPSFKSEEDSVDQFFDSHGHVIWLFDNLSDQLSFDQLSSELTVDKSRFILFSDQKSKLVNLFSSLSSVFLVAYQSVDMMSEVFQVLESIDSKNISIFFICSDVKDAFPEGFLAQIEKFNGIVYQQSPNFLALNSALMYSLKQFDHQLMLEQSQIKQSFLTSRIDAVLEASITPIAILEEGFLLQCNEAFFEFMSIDKETLLGTPLLDYIASDFVDPLKNALNESIYEKQSLSVLFNGQLDSVKVSIFCFKEEKTPLYQISVEYLAERDDSLRLLKRTDFNSIWSEWQKLSGYYFSIHFSQKSLLRESFEEIESVIDTIDKHCIQNPLQGIFIERLFPSVLIGFCEKSSLYYESLNEKLSEYITSIELNIPIRMNSFTLNILKIESHHSFRDCLKMLSFPYEKQDTPTNSTTISSSLSLEEDEEISSYAAPESNVSSTENTDISNASKEKLAIDSNVVVRDDAVAPLEETTSDEEISEEVFIQRSIKKALKDRNVIVLFQPIISLAGVQGDIYEVFVRILREDGEIEYTPNQFFPIASEMGVASQIDKLVTLKSLKMLATEFSKKNSIKLTLNLHEDSIKDDEFLRWFRKISSSSRLPKGSITFQVTMNTFKKYQDSALLFFKAIMLLQHFTSISQYDVTDFDYFQEMFVDFFPNSIKFDGKVINYLENKEELFESFKEQVSFFKENTIKTIVSMVENTAILSSLWGVQVDYIQGYYLQKPSPEMDYEFDSF